MDPETLDTVPLVGYPIRGYSEGFHLAGFWLRVGQACLTDLLTNGKLPRGSDEKFWRQTALIGVIPYIHDERFQSDGTESTDRVKEVYLNPLCRRLGLPLSAERLEVISLGHAGVHAAVARSEALLTSSDLKRVIVLGVDSYLDTLTLGWLAKYERLKTSANPKGLIPGEAGACFLLETKESAAARNAVPLATTDGVCVAKEPNNLFSENPNQGEGLVQAINQAMSLSSVKLPFCGDIVCDHNGEDWKAIELAAARLQLADRISPESRVIAPAASVGDVGAASGPLSVCVAVSSLIRSYSTGDFCTVVSSSDHGDVGCTCVMRAN